MTEDELVADYAEALDGEERRVLLSCSPGQSWGYARLAEKLSVSYDEIQLAGRYLQMSRLATIMPIRHGRNFAGSAIFLTPRGERVRQILEQTQTKRDYAPHR